MNPINARDVPSSSEEDEFNMAINGGVPIEQREGTNFRVRVPSQLMGAGEHFDDDPDRSVRRRRVSQRYNQGLLPRDNMLIHVNDLGLQRPIRSSLTL